MIPDLYYPPPLCPLCHADLEFDGDNWRCEDCVVKWDMDGQDARANGPRCDKRSLRDGYGCQRAVAHAGLHADVDDHGGVTHWSGVT